MGQTQTRYGQPDSARGDSHLVWRASFHPDLEGGGAFYDVIPLGGDQWLLAAGNVHQHKARATRLRSAVYSDLRNCARSCTSTAEITTRVNQTLCRDFDLGNSTGVSLFLAHIRADGPRLTYTNAGHPPPLVWDLHRLVPAPLVAGGSLLGTSDSTTYGETELHLAPGWRLLACAGGASGAQELRGACCDAARIQTLVSHQLWTAPDRFLDQLRRDLNRLSGRNSANDDLMLLWAGSRGHAVPPAGAQVSD